MKKTRIVETGKDLFLENSIVSDFDSSLDSIEVWERMDKIEERRRTASLGFHFLVLLGFLCPKLQSH